MPNIVPIGWESGKVLEKKYHIKEQGDEGDWNTIDNFKVCGVGLLKEGDGDGMSSWHEIQFGGGCFRMVRGWVKRKPPRFVMFDVKSFHKNMLKALTCLAIISGTPFYGLGTSFDGTPFERLGTPFEGATF
ncbi:hypothetical protein CsSME_00037456 [Camellia sinensis var. sinensis]